MKRRREKEAACASIIGGADGPTSIFLMQEKKESGMIKRIRQGRYKRRRKKAETLITANPHTLDEVIRYMKDVYKVRERKPTTLQYQEQKKCMKASLVMQHRPELLGDLEKTECLEKADERSIKEFLKKQEEREKRAEAVPDEEFPLDYHIYERHIGKDGSITIEIEKNWKVLGIGYSGNKRMMKVFERAAKDIYLYYGVSEEDIRSRSERFESLVSMLIS